VREGKANKLNGNGKRQPDYDPRLDTPLAGGRRVTSELKEQIKRNAGGNPVMEAILADTAVSTLPKMIGDRNLGSNDVAQAGGQTVAKQGIPQIEQINGTPEQVFGEETASRWADLAFAEPKKPA